MKYVLFIYLKKYWLIAFRGTEKQCRKHLSKMGDCHYIIAENKKGFSNLPVVNTTFQAEGIIGDLKHINHTVNYNNKLSQKVWIDIRLASPYLVEGELYNQMLDNKFVKIGRLVTRIDKYLTVISHAEAYCNMGLDRDSVIRTIQSFYPRINLIDVPLGDEEHEYKHRTAFKISVLIFEEYQMKPKAVQGELML